MAKRRKEHGLGFCRYFVVLRTQVDTQAAKEIAEELRQLGLQVDDFHIQQDLEFPSVKAQRTAHQAINVKAETIRASRKSNKPTDTFFREFWDQAFQETL